MSSQSHDKSRTGKGETETKTTNSKTGETDKVVIFDIGSGSNGQGFGSLVMCAMFLGLYYDNPNLHVKRKKKKKNGLYPPRRRLIIRETDEFRKYRWNQTHGMFNGFFQPQFRNDNQQVMEIVQDVSALPYQTNCSFPYNDKRSWTCEAISFFTREESSSDSSEDSSEDASEVPYEDSSSENNFYDFRWEAKEELKVPEPQRPTNNMTAWMTNTKRSLRIFSNMMEYMCRNLPRERIHPGIQSQIDDIISSFWKTNTKNNNKRKKIKLAFHIRRTDKKVEFFYNNRKYYTCDQYVKTLLEQYESPTYQSQHDTDQASNNYQIDKDVEEEEEPYCFVATDDYAAINELQNALQQYNISCNLLTLTTPDYRPTRSATDLIMVLAQIQLLVQAEVFVGTYSSNLSDLVALWRGCEYYSNAGTSAGTTAMPNFDNKFHHYFQSYGADVQDWFFI